MKALRSQNGFTITELMVVIVISGLLMAAAATGFGAFFSKFNEMSKKMELQRDAFNCLQTIKNGIKIDTGANMRFQGIATADSIQFTGVTQLSAQDVYLFLPATDYTHKSDKIRIYLENGYVRYRYWYATLNPPPGYIFPSERRKDNDFYVTKLRFSKADNGVGTAKVVLVELDARVRIRDGEYRYVSYSTKMALTMK